jgi:hypothetical protein
MADEQNSNLGESVRETLASRSTEKALNNLKLADTRTDAQKAASAEFFAEKNRKKRRRPWK